MNGAPAQITSSLRGASSLQQNAVVFGVQKKLLRLIRAYQYTPKTIERVDELNIAL